MLEEQCARSEHGDGMVEMVSSILHFDNLDHFIAMLLPSGVEIGWKGWFQESNWDRYSSRGNGEAYTTEGSLGGSGGLSLAGSC